MAMKSNILAMLVSAFSGMALGGVLSLRVRIGRFKGIKTIEYRFATFLDLITKWVCLREIDRTILSTLKSNSIHSVAIYGMRTLGRCVIDELADTDVSIIYAIDDGKENIYSDIPVIATSDDYPPVDAIIVTSIQNFIEIKTSLRDKTDARIINLVDLVNDSYYKEFVQ